MHARICISTTSHMKIRIRYCKSRENCNTRNNTDGNKLVIFSGIALYYGDTYIVQLYTSPSLKLIEWCLFIYVHVTHSTVKWSYVTVIAVHNCITVVAIHGGRCAVREGSKLGQGCGCLHQTQKLVRNHSLLPWTAWLYTYAMYVLLYPLRISTENI